MMSETLPVSQDFLASLKARKICRAPSLDVTPSKDQELPIVWRADETNLKIYFARTPPIVEERCNEERLPCGATLKKDTETGKGRLIVIPLKHCGIHTDVGVEQEKVGQLEPLAMSMRYDADVDALSIDFIPLETMASLSLSTLGVKDDIVFDGFEGRVLSIEFLFASDSLELGWLQQ